MERRRVIIAGGGFGGVQLARHLDPELFDVLLVDKVNHHMFQPLFYQVATSQLEPSSISFPLRKIFQNRKNIQIRLAEVSGIIPERNEIETSIGNFSYDFLVLATGCKTNFFGNYELMRNSMTLKSTYDAIRIRNEVLQGFEDLVSAPEDEKEYLLNIVIVGAGPTGVELAGAFAEIKKNILPKDFPQLDLKDLKIILLEGATNTLNTMSSLAQKSSERYLRRMGVDIIMNVFVRNYDGRNVFLSNGETIRSKKVIWTAGITGNLVKGLREDIILRNNRIRVDRHSLVQGYKNIYAIGDLAYMETPKYPHGHPQVANVAINQARTLAKNLKALLRGKAPTDYEYRNLGTMATVGINKAVVDLPFLRFRGYFAWLTWMFLHLMLILSVRNKMIIFINWAWSYIFRDTSLRLILKDPDSSSNTRQA